MAVGTVIVVVNVQRFKQRFVHACYCVLGLVSEKRRMTYVKADVEIIRAEALYKFYIFYAACFLLFGFNVCNFADIHFMEIIVGVAGVNN